jgi:hypothetical protein
MPIEGLRLVLPGFRYRAAKSGVVEHELCPVFCAFAEGPPFPDAAEVAAARRESWGTFSPDVIMVKRDTRIALSAHRHGRRLSLTAKASRYDDGHPEWVNHRDAKVVFQRKTTRAWKSVRSHATNRRGVATARFRTRNRARYRALLRPTPTAWGERAGAVARSWECRLPQSGADVSAA